MSKRGKGKEDDETLTPKHQTLNYYIRLSSSPSYEKEERDRYTDLERERERNPLPRLEEGEDGEFIVIFKAEYN